MSEQILHIPRSMNNTEVSAKNITIDHFYSGDCYGYAYSTQHSPGSLVEKPYGYQSMLIPYDEVYPAVIYTSFWSFIKNAKKDHVYQKIADSTYVYDVTNRLVCINTEFAETITLWNKNSAKEQGTYAYNSSYNRNATSPNYHFQRPQSSASVKLNPGQLLLACLFVVPIFLGFV